MVDNPSFNPHIIKAKINRAKEKRGILSGGVIPDFKRIEGSGPLNQHGMPKLPVGQSQVPNWPVLDLGIVPHIQLNDWRLTISGLVEHPFQLTWDDFMALPQYEDISDFHCVTTWSRMDMKWVGVQFKTLAQKAKPQANAQYVYITGYDGYSTNLKLQECLDDDVLIVHTADHAPLTREHGGPARMITPKKYAWKGSKWIKEIIFLEEDRLGFWELRGYSNTAEPWYNDRYAQFHT